MKIFKIENGYTVIKDIEGDLKSLQREVGGLITLAPHFDELTNMGIDIYADDEGLLKANPKPSVFVMSKNDAHKIEAVLVGNLVFVSCDDEGNTKGLTQEQIDYISNHLTSVTYADKNGRSGKAFTFVFAGEEE